MSMHEDEAVTAVGRAAATPVGLDGSGLETRSLLAQSLRPSSFPADREQLIETARQEQASVDIVAILQHLSPNRTFDVLEEVYEALGGHGEDSDHRP